MNKIFFAEGIEVLLIRKFVKKTECKENPALRFFTYATTAFRSSFSNPIMHRSAPAVTIVPPKIPKISIEISLDRTTKYPPRRTVAPPILQKLQILLLYGEILRSAITIPLRDSRVQARGNKASITSFPVISANAAAANAKTKPMPITISRMLHTFIFFFHNFVFFNEVRSFPIPS